MNGLHRRMFHKDPVFWDERSDKQLKVGQDLLFRLKDAAKSNNHCNIIVTNNLNVYDNYLDKFGRACVMQGNYAISVLEECTFSPVLKPLIRVRFNFYDDTMDVAGLGPKTFSVPVYNRRGFSDDYLNVRFCLVKKTRNFDSKKLKYLIN